MNADKMNFENHGLAEEQLWSAYLYVNGEMPVAEAMQFELKLQESVELCDMVGKLTLLNDLLGDHYLRTLPRVTLASEGLDSKSPERLRGRQFNQVPIICLCTGFFVVISMLLIGYTNNNSVELEQNKLANQEGKLQPLTVQEMSGMLGIWLNKPVIHQENSGSGVLETTDEDAEGPLLISESPQQSEVPEWLLLALQIEEDDGINSDEI